MDADTRSRSGAAVLIGGVAVVLLLTVWVAAAGPALQWKPNSGAGDPEPAQVQAPERAASGQRCTDGPCDSPDGQFATIVVVFFVVVSVVLIVAMVALLRSGVSRRLRRHSPPSHAAPGVPLPDVAEAVRDDAERQYAALRTGAPRNAIVECWARLEHTVTSTGLTVRGSATSTETTQRVLATYLVDDAAITRLAALYREARFSRHEISEAMRNEAIETLALLHDGLARRAASGGASR